MAPIVVEFGRARTERRSLSLARADKDRILQHFPEKVSVSVPGFGAQDYPLRAQVKAFLDHIQPPAVKATFEVSGKPDDPASIAIHNARLKVIGIHSGSVNILNAAVAYRFDVDVESDGTSIEPCACADGQDGQRVERTFKLIWTVEIEIEPGIGGTFEVEEADIAIQAPCCCAHTARAAGAEGEGEADDEKERGEGKKKSGKKKRKGRD
jgi:hypothetical protein